LNKNTLLFKNLESILFVKKIKSLLLSKDDLNGSQVTVTAFIMLQNIFISNKCFSFEFSIYIGNLFF